MDNLEEKELISIEGTIENITFRNEENGFTVFEFSNDDEGYVTAVGEIGNLYPGEKVIFSGSWAVHPTFGKQFKVESYVPAIPETADEMLIFLSSGIVKGVKEKTAQKIVAEFGDSTFEVLELYPERLARIRGISHEKAMEISRAYCRVSKERNAVIALEKYGLSTNEALKIFNKFGSKSAEMVEHNPYSLCNAGLGIDFDRACRIAGSLEKAPADEFRIREGVIYILRHNLYQQGHTCVPRESIIAPCRSLTGCTEDDAEKAIDDLIDIKRLIDEELYNRNFIFLPDIYEAEKSAAKSLLFYKRYAAKSFPEIDEQIKKAEVIGGVCYNEKQRLAIKLAVEKGMLVLTGGPGTGKTTTLRGILCVFEDQGLETVLAAPTGRAAKRMSELTGKEATTIHRLLEVEWDTEESATFKRNKRNPLTAQAVIIDELSMVDIQLFSALLEALPIGCRLVMVGDSDQLPPVGAGNVLQDIIESKAVPTVELDEVFRQAMESMIISNAHRIVRGEIPDLTVKDKDFFFLDRALPADAALTICDLAETRLPNAYNYSSVDDIQILCPSKKGETGTVNINKLLQQRLNPHEKGKPEHHFGGRVFRLGDKLMQTKNNYGIEWESGGVSGLGVYNGDIGVLKKIDEEGQTLTVVFDDRTALIPFEYSKDLEHAYAVTVHKSQGSEFPAVIVPVTGINSMLEYRNLLYTAVTRAKEIIVLVGREATVRRMVENDRKQKRYSALKAFIMLGDS